MATQLLTNLERRTIANLSIPRNAFDLERMLREDPYVQVKDTDKTLHSLAKNGWVVSLGDGHENSGKLAAAADSHAKTIDLPDEKLKLYEARLQVPTRSWRVQGEQWMMTQEGFDQLHVPIMDAGPMETWRLQAEVNAQAQRIHSGEITDKTRLASDKNGDAILTEEEFAAWLKGVIATHKELTGETIHPPVAGGAGYSDATELLILDPENGKGSAYTETAPWFMAAVTVAVTDADTGSTITEANYTGYARKSVAAADMNTASAGAATNANAITFAACTALSSAVIGFGKCAALTVGRLIKYGSCALVNVTSTQTPLSFAVAAFSTTLD